MTKLEIKGYKKHPLEGGGGGPSFTAKVNPEKLSLKRMIEFNSDDTTNTTRDIFQYKGYEADKLSFELLIDGTGVIKGAKEDVHSRLKELNKVVYEYDGQEHKSNYLKVIYAGINFICHLQTMDIQYLLFDSGGKPLRAKVAMSFIESVHPKHAEHDAYKQSPDMTHVKTVREGDSIFQMSEEVYGNFKYYVEVARANGLVNFRSIKPGTRLLFPPLAK